MEVVPYSAARQQMKMTMDKVCADHEPIIITRQREKSVVMMSLEDYHAMEETVYLMRSPANAKRLQESVQQFERGQITIQAIDELQ